MVYDWLIGRKMFSDDGLNCGMGGPPAWCEAGKCEVAAGWYDAAADAW